MAPKGDNLRCQRIQYCWHCDNSWSFLTTPSWLAVKIQTHCDHVSSDPGRGSQVNYSGVIMNGMASQITDVSIVCIGADQRNPLRSASLAFVMGIHRWPVDSPHKGPVTPFDDVIVVVAADGTVPIDSVHLPCWPVAIDDAKPSYIMSVHTQCRLIVWYHANSSNTALG